MYMQACAYTCISHVLASAWVHNMLSGQATAELKLQLEDKKACLQHAL